MALKPQDVMVVMKLCCYPGERPPISAIASDLRLSPSEVHGAMKRLQVARLLHGTEMKSKPNVSALVEFLLHGFKYVFPAELGQPLVVSRPRMLRRPSMLKSCPQMSFHQSGLGMRVTFAVFLSSPCIKPCLSLVQKILCYMSIWRCWTQSAAAERASGT